MISCEQHDYIEIACTFRYPLKLTLISGEVIEGIGIDTACNAQKQECIEIDSGGKPDDVEGECSGDWTGGQIVDEVLVPQSLKPGAYVVGWRWDVRVFLSFFILFACVLARCSLTTLFLLLCARVCVRVCD